MNLLIDIQRSLEKNPSNNAFCINNKFYTYKEFSEIISSIRSALQNSNLESENNIGLITNDDIQTYASIIALWLEGKAYIPLNPAFPIARNI